MSKLIKGKELKTTIIINQLKFWIRTIATQVSEKHFEKYFNEFSYRISRSQSKATIFHKIIQKMVFAHPFSHKMIIQKLNN